MSGRHGSNIYIVVVVSEMKARLECDGVNVILNGKEWSL